MNVLRCFLTNFVFFCLLLFLVTTGQSCSSLNKAPLNTNLDLVAPAIRPSLLKGKEKDLHDYKLRTNRAVGIVLAVHFDQNSKNESDSNISKAMQLIVLHQLRQAGVTIKKIPEENWLALQKKERENYYTWFKENNIDAVLNAGIQQINNKVEYNLVFWDPVFAHKTAVLQLPLEIRSRAIDQEHQSELLVKKHSYDFLKFKFDPVPVLPESFSNDLSAFVLKSVQGSMNIQTSVSNINIYLSNKGKKKFLGKPPFSAMQLDEGKYSLLIKRKGYPDQNLDFFIRAGKKTDHFISYPDTQTSSTVAVLSSPAGQRVSVDGQVVGTTPHYISGLSPGSYQLELSHKEKNSESYYITADGPLEINAGLASERLLLSSYLTRFGSDFIAEDFFSLTSEKGKISLDNDNPGLRFHSKGAPTGSWVGLVSRPLVINDFAATLSVEENPEQIISFGLVSGATGDQKPQVLVNLDQGLYSLLEYKNNKLISPKHSYTSKKSTSEKEKNINAHEIRIEFEKKEKILSISIDGTEIYSGPRPDLFAGQTTRLVIYTRAKNANGSLIAHEFRMYSGPGLSEEK